MKKFNKIFEVIDSVENLDEDFKDIIETAKKCKFSNCTHTNEPECAVKKAILDGILEEERLTNYNIVIKESEYVFNKKNKTKAVDYMKQKKLFR